MPRLAATLVLLLAAAACTPRHVVSQPSAPPAPRVDIDALLRRGCFHCFEQALAAARADGDSGRAFAAAALLVVRAKELGLPIKERVADLRRLAATDPGSNELADLVSAIPMEPLSGNRYSTDLTADFAQRRRARTIVEGWNAVPDTAPGTALLRAYLALAVACSIQAPDGQTAGDVARNTLEQWPDVPLLAVLAAMCTGDVARLSALRTADPDLVDVEYAIGRIESESRVPDLDDSLRHLQAAREAFPDSLAVLTALGNLRVQREEWAEALPPFDEVIATLPVHRDALLGRVISLTRLRRYDEAIAAATRMIDLGEWLLGPAYYWRAFDELQLRTLDAAAADRDHAKMLMSNAAVYLLSGLIEWGMKRPAPAEAEFQQALTLDFGQCDAALYMGAVRVELGRRPEAVAAFKQAIQCYDLSIGLRKKMIDDVRAGAGSDAAKARVIATHERAIAEAASQRDEAARDVATVEKSL